MKNQKNQNPPPIDPFWGESIHTYTRKNALDDGVLVAAPADLARRAGWVNPPDLAVTAAVYCKCIEWDPRDGAHDSEEKRWVQLLKWALHGGIASARRNTDETSYPFSVCAFERGNGFVMKIEKLKGECHENDSGDPALTIMLPDED